MTDHLLEVANLTVRYAGQVGAYAVEDFDLCIDRRVRMGLVGESGSGKSSIIKSILGLIRPPHTVNAKRIYLDGVGDLATMTPAQMRAMRARDVGYIGQNPFGAMHPVVNVARQFEGFLRDHDSWKGRDSLSRVATLLADLGIGDPPRVLGAHAGELSGGMAQRVAIALASLLSPSLLIADEPTTALDVTVQRQVLDLIAQPRKTSEQALLLVTHDLSVVAQYCDEVVVMQLGKVVERGPVASVFTEPQHPYTKKLLSSVPGGAPEPQAPPTPEGQAATTRSLRFRRERLRTAGEASTSSVPVMMIEHVDKTFRRAGTSIAAVCDVSLSIGRGETVALVGESGSGKSTLGRIATMLERPDAGRVALEGRDINNLSSRNLCGLRPRMQIVFQEPYQSLNPQLKARNAVSEPLGNLRPKLSKTDIDDRVREAFVMAGLNPDKGDRYPHQLSGGEQQRVGIARAVVTRPSFVVLDEPTSSLDLTVRAAIVDQLQKLQEELGMSYLFISHDLATAQQIADRIVVMYKGSVVESGPAWKVLTEPLHPYTQTLSEACLDPDPRVAPRPRQRPVLIGDILPGACPYHQRCTRSSELCKEAPKLCDPVEHRRVACFHPLDAASASEAPPQPMPNLDELLVTPDPTV